MGHQPLTQADRHRPPVPGPRRGANLGRIVGHILLLAALALASPAWSQDGKKKEEAGFLVVLLPLGLLALMSLQVATIAAFPRFSRRCAAAVRRYRWQTGLIGLVAFLAVILLSAIVGSAANAAAGIPLGLGALCAAIGGVGVSLEVGRWAMTRTGQGEAPHPIIQIIAGSSLVGWGALLIPCAGQIGWLIVSCMAMGGFVYALVRGETLDEAPPRRPDTAAPSTRPPATVAHVEPASEAAAPTPERPGAQAGTEEGDDYGDQVF